MSDRNGLRNAKASPDQGFALVTLMVVMLPLLLVVGAALSLVDGRNEQLLRQIRDQRVLLAAEAAIDDAVFRVATGTLIDGYPVERELGGGVSYRIEPALLSTDGVDNDGDSSIDETDEQVFRVVVTGTYGPSETRITCTLPTAVGFPVPAAAVVCAVPIPIVQSDTARIDGHDFELGGSGGDPAYDAPGAAVQPPYTATDLATLHSPSESGLVTGSSGSPSFAATPGDLDIAALAQWVRDNADVVFSSDHTATGVIAGDASADDFKVVHCQEDLTMSAGAAGAGILLIEDDLFVTGESSWNGLVIVLDSFVGAGGAHITGGMLMGPSASEIRMSGNDEILRSNTLLLKTGLGAPPISGWREPGRY